MNLRDFENDLKDLIKVPVLDNVITVYEKWKDRIIEDDD